MPFLNGIDTTKLIKQNCKYNNIPIIAITAYAFEENIKKILESGFDDYISKPIKKADFLSKIEYWTNNKHK